MPIFFFKTLIVRNLCSSRAPLSSSKVGQQKKEKGVHTKKEEGKKEERKIDRKKERKKERKKKRKKERKKKSGN